MDSAPTPRRRRGRLPDPERTAQTRAAILRAALATFLERGYDGTRMADVAARAGLAKGTLYVHFADKDVLFESILRDLVTEPLASLMAERPAEDLPPRQLLERLILPLLHEFEGSGRASVLRLIIAEGSRFPALAAIHRRVVIEPITALVLAALSRIDTPQARTLTRFPPLIGAPIIMTVLWNGLWNQSEPLDPAAMFSAFLDLVFPPDRPA